MMTDTKCPNCAASTPSAVSIVRPIKSLTLGDKYIGKIAEQEAVELVNAVIQSQIDIAGIGTPSAEVQALRFALEAIIASDGAPKTIQKIATDVLNQPHTGGK